MSEYNNFFDLSAPQFGFNPANFENPAPLSGQGQSEAWTTLLQPSVGLMGGDTAAQLQIDVDSAPLAGAGSLGIPYYEHKWGALPKPACAVCFEPYQTDSSLHQHAKEAGHQAYKCKCGTGFNKASALKRHIDTQHTLNTFACVLCRDEFVRKDKLQDHWHNFHKASKEGVQFLSGAQELKPRAGAPSRRRRAPVPRVAASSGSSASPARAPAHAPGPFVWPPVGSTGQQCAGLPASPCVPAGPPATTTAVQIPGSSSSQAGHFAPGADSFAIDPSLGQSFSGLFDGFLGDSNWTTGFDSSNF